nr:ribosome small subunit-dependent GTPase A [Methylonatrum kenyense]
MSGRVLVGYGPTSVVHEADDRLYRCVSRRRTGRAICGDHVRFSLPQPNEGVIEEILPRRNTLSRTNYRGQVRPLAANIDCMMVVLAPEPAPDPELVDRYLVLAHDLSVKPVLLLNKVDLVADGGAAETRLLGEWQQLGVETRQLSAKTGRGLDSLARTMAGGTAILLGQSGVGKSSLINALIPDLPARTQALSRTSGQGRHTTTETTLYPLESGGALMDSPGIRILRLAHLDPPALAAGFSEIGALAEHCHYRDCRHEDEPDCAVLAAADQGGISARRLASYQALLRERKAVQP